MSDSMPHCLPRVERPTHDGRPAETAIMAHSLVSAIDPAPDYS
ncbi:MAG: hypothetical protein M0026_06645 [Nocardiopsaceae bacterium]|nr:hypothetical protein [Nocardiopsaceae bacterium]